MWGRGRIDHVGLAAASPEAFETIRRRLVDAGASDGTINDFGTVHSMFFRETRTGSRARSRGLLNTSTARPVGCPNASGGAA